MDENVPGARTPGRKTRVLVIVAHPDDETIWMGGTLLMNRGDWDITILSLCRRDDPDRAPRFGKACREYWARCRMSDLEDDRLGRVGTGSIIGRVMKNAGKRYDIVFTHGMNGEYGHVRHRNAHRAVVKMLSGGKLSAGRIYFFSYRNTENACVAEKKSDVFISLKPIYFQSKKKIIREIYGFEEGSFEDTCSREAEAFRIHK